MIFPFQRPAVHAPVGIMPVVALHQQDISGCYQFLRQFGILCEFGTDDLFHDPVLHILPIPA